MPELHALIKKLKEEDNIDAVFITGSHGRGEQKPYSDLDLVIILRENTHQIKCVYTWIDGIFADIFFFDRADLQRITQADDIDANSIDGILLSWLEKANLEFDKTGSISELQKNKTVRENCDVTDSEQRTAHQKISYNFVANARYFESDDPLYHEALEIRLLYSVIELITGYFILRGIPWRGEKNAVAYCKVYDPEFYGLFQKYTQSSDLKTRFELYRVMVARTLPDGYSLWSQHDTIAVPKNPNADSAMLKEYWERLVI
jgi:hypothetical protein